MRKFAVGYWVQTLNIFRTNHYADSHVLDLLLKRLKAPVARRLAGRYSFSSGGTLLATVCIACGEAHRRYISASQAASCGPRICWTRLINRTSPKVDGVVTRREGFL